MKCNNNKLTKHNGKRQNYNKSCIVAVGIEKDINNFSRNHSLAKKTKELRKIYQKLRINGKADVVYGFKLVKYLTLY